MSVDVVICTNRPKMVWNQVKQLKKCVPFERFIVVDSSRFLNKPFYSGLGVEVLHTPLVKLGDARQTGLVACSSELVFFVDDDIVLGSDCFLNLGGMIGLFIGAKMRSFVNGLSRTVLSGFVAGGLLATIRLL